MPLPRSVNAISNVTDVQYTIEDTNDKPQSLCRKVLPSRWRHWLVMVTYNPRLSIAYYLKIMHNHLSLFS